MEWTKRRSLCPPPRFTPATSAHGDGHRLHAAPPAAVSVPASACGCVLFISLLSYFPSPENSRIILGVPLLGLIDYVLARGRCASGAGGSPRILLGGEPSTRIGGRGSCCALALCFLEHTGCFPVSRNAILSELVVSLFTKKDTSAAVHVACLAAIVWDWEIHHR